MKFEQNYSYIGGVDTYPLQSVAILFNLTADLSKAQPYRDRAEPIDKEYDELFLILTLSTLSP